MKQFKEGMINKEVYAMDTYVEYSFVVKPALWQSILRNWLYALGIIFIICGTLFPVFLPVAILALVLAVFYHRRLKLQWEYTLINDELFFDKIINNEKRKRAYKADLNNIISFSKFEQNNNNKKINFTSNMNHQIYELVISTDRGKVSLLIEANDELITGIKARHYQQVNL